MCTRVRPTESGTELETLTQLLDFLRATVVTKATGVSDEQAADHPVPASELTVAGLVKHLTGTERFWFSIDFADLDVPWPWTDDDPHGNFKLAKTDTLAGVVADYEAECERSRRAIAGQALDTVAGAEAMNFTLRYALAHMIEETARHCGHLDLLRESIDGVRGE
ncbi:MAG: DinB family protein [Nocardioidaceae bacterium]